MTEQRHSARTAPLWIITSLGAAITALGVYIQATGTLALGQVIAGTLAALGGGIIGAAISIYFSAGEGRDTLLAVRELLAGSLRAGMYSSEEDLSLVRRPWHYYYLTQKDGTYQWRYIPYRFDQSNTVGSIILLNKDRVFGREQTFRAEVAVRGDRMIMVESWEDSSEPPIIVVTPAFAEEFRPVRAGVAFLRSWDGTDLVTKCLWSTSSLVDSTAYDLPSEHASMLDGLWDRHFHAIHQVLPSASDKPARMPAPRAPGTD